MRKSGKKKPKMTEQKLNTALFSEIITNDDLVSVLELLSGIKEIVFKKEKETQLNDIKAQTPKRFFGIVESLISQYPSDTGLTQAISQLEKQLQSLNTLTATLTYSPSRAQTEQLAKKLQTLIQEPFILSTKIDEEMGLGIHIEFQGKIYKRTTEDIVTS